MLYLIHGTDIQKSLAKARKMVETMIIKKPNASLFKINSDNFDLAQIQEFVGGQGLFENKYIGYSDIEIQKIKRTYDWMKSVKHDEELLRKQYICFQKVELPRNLRVGLVCKYFRPIVVVILELFDVLGISNMMYLKIQQMPNIYQLNHILF